MEKSHDIISRIHQNINKALNDQELKLVNLIFFKKLNFKFYSLFKGITTKLTLKILLRILFINNNNNDNNNKNSAWGIII